MKFQSVVLALVLGWGAAGAHANFTYNLSSPDDLSNINVGQQVHFDVFLPGISSQTWSDTAIFNASAQSSVTALWGTPFNVVFNPALSLVSNSATAGRLSYLHISTPLTMTSDLVASFDIIAAAAGTGTFFANGADIFQATPSSDTRFTVLDSEAFTISDSTSPMPAPTSIALFCLGLMGLTRIRYAA